MPMQIKNKQHLVDKKADKEESDEEESSSEEDLDENKLDFKLNDNEINNYKLKFDRLYIDRLKDSIDKLDKESSEDSKELNNKLNANEKEAKKSEELNSQPNSTVVNKKNSSNEISNQIKNELINKNDDKFANQLNAKDKFKTQNQLTKTLSYFNNRLKARHVVSEDQLRILRREGQPLRLSCLPAFHAPSGSIVNWFKNGDLIKVKIFFKNLI